MTTNTIGRWLLVTLAIVGLAFATSAASAHGVGTTADDARPYNATAEEWATWMEAHMTDHMGPGSVEWMEEQTGLTVEEMAEDMADGDFAGHWGPGAGPGTYGPGYGMHGPGYGTYGSGYGMHGPGYGTYGPGYGMHGSGPGTYGPGGC